MTTSFLGRARLAAALVTALVATAAAALNAEPASANFTYWDGGTTQVEIHCSGDWGIGTVDARSSSSVPWGSPHYRVLIYNGSQLMLASGWFPSGSGGRIYSASTVRYWATHFFVQHARIYNGTWNYTPWQRLEYFVRYGDRTDNCLF